MALPIFTVMRGLKPQAFFLRIFSLCLFLSGLGLSAVSLHAQVKDPQAIRAMIVQFKKEPRGPYKDIRWFCPDGSTRPARDPCPDGPGNQHARYRDDVVALAKKEHVFFGQILTNTPYADFWDEGHGHSRLMQYQMERYLRRTDGEWIHRRAQYYRGAVQIEDESAWGIQFYRWLLKEAGPAREIFFLVRQSASDIPHATDTRNAQRVRSLSKEIADTLPSFQNLRIKIHGSPDAGDLAAVREFRARHRTVMTADILVKMDQLLREMEQLYRPFRTEDLRPFRKRLPANSLAARAIDTFLLHYPLVSGAAPRCRTAAIAMEDLRAALSDTLSGDARLAMIDLSVQLEALILRETSGWHTTTVAELLERISILSQAAAAAGFLEVWEWEEVRADLQAPATDSLSLEVLRHMLDQSVRVVEWGTAMARCHYQPVIRLYQSFEPLAGGFLDDRIRSSVLLPLGEAVSRLGEWMTLQTGSRTRLMDVADGSDARGLNPGLAAGELVVDPPGGNKLAIDPGKIYVFHQPPADLKPVAGIATVEEGNLVSHVQLLARNLGIPNARISRQQLEALRAWQGTRVFYAVAADGTVIMKPEVDMDATEVAFFREKERSLEQIAVPVEDLALADPRILNLREVDGSFSGYVCGPKAANLGQLKRLFPDHVVEGLVLPFAVFRQHMDQPIPGREETYWRYLQKVFARGDRLRAGGASDLKVEDVLIRGLDTLRSLMREMPFLPDFEAELRRQFEEVLGSPMGEVPVFVRSDTNMEDLKEFTGAGLNLTLFNVRDPQMILQGIRDVWASPYSERSFRWRQRYLLNPEHVYPSILLIPSVDADRSGVLITRGVTTGRDEDLTVAFNRGVGGAVDGQSAETWLLEAGKGWTLLAPARERQALTIPASGGSVSQAVTLEERILAPEHLEVLSALADRMREVLPYSPGLETGGPFDVELGFREGKLWLFQVRPFVENRQTARSEYLSGLVTPFDGMKQVSLHQKLPDNAHR